MIQTKGQISSCKNKLKSILCRDRFPRCTGKEVIWGQLRMECIKAIKCCPPKVQEILRNIDLCRKVGNGEKLAQKCERLCLSSFQYLTSVLSVLASTITIFCATIISKNYYFSGNDNYSSSFSRRPWLILIHYYYGNNNNDTIFILYLYYICFNFLPSLKQAIFSLITSMAFEKPGLLVIFLLMLSMSGPLL